MSLCQLVIITNIIIILFAMDIVKYPYNLSKSIFPIVIPTKCTTSMLLLYAAIEALCVLPNTMDAILVPYNTDDRAVQHSLPIHELPC